MGNSNNSMVKYVLKRTVLAIPVFFCITLLVYLLISLAPTNIVDSMLAGQQYTQEEYDMLYKQYNLDKPVLVQYGLWLKGFVQGDWGRSYMMNANVADLIKDRVKPSILLSCVGMLLGMIVGIPLGIMSGYKPNSFWDHFSSGLSAVCSAFPIFFLGLLMIYIFCVTLGWFPTSGMYDPKAPTHELGDLIRHLTLPAIMIALQSVTSYIKQTRNAMLEVVHEEYVKTARSKGLSERAVIVGHAFRNSLAPVITSIALSIPRMVAGSVVTEQIFGWPGMGSMLINAINNHDFPVIMGITVLIAIAVLFAGILADVLYAAADPRVSYN